MIISLYVDDLLITGSLKKDIASLKDAMNHAYSMTDLGFLSQFLGLKIAQSQHGVKVLKVCFIFSHQVQHEILQAKEDSFAFRS